MTRIARVAAALATVSLAVTCLAGQTGGASTSGSVNVVDWDSNYGLAIENALVNAVSVFDKGNVAQACATIAKEGKKGLSDPYPPNSRLAFHWGAAMAFDEIGGTECSAALANPNKTLLNQALNSLSQGQTQLRDFASEVKALL